MTITKELLEEIKAKAEDAQKVCIGSWEHDRERMLDTPYKHHEFLVIDAGGCVICDTFNSDGGLIEDDRDGEGGSAWNEVSRRRIQHIARMDPPTTLSLISALEDARRDLDDAAKAYGLAIAERDTLRAENEKFRVVLRILTDAVGRYREVGPLKGVRNDLAQGEDLGRAALDPDLGRIKPGHVCKHGIRWPHACDECGDAALRLRDAMKETTHAD